MKISTRQNRDLSLRRKKILSEIMHDTKSWILILPTLLVLYFFTIRPIAIGAWYSLHNMQGFTVTDFVGLKNYITILSDTQLPRVLWNTIQYVLWSLVIGFIPPIAIAIMLNEMIHFRSIFKFSIYFPSIVPALAATMLWYYIYFPDQSGLLNILLSKFGIEPLQWLQMEKITIPLIIIMTTWKACGSSMIFYLAALQSVNQELYEAAIIDGAGFFCRVRKITIPQIAGIILLNLVRQIIGVFQILTEPMTMTGGGPNGASTSLALWSYRTAFVDFNAATSLAIGVITFIILIILTCFYFWVQKKVDVD